MLKRHLGTVALSIVVGGGCVTQEAPAGTKLVSIQVVDAVISPGKASHESWDGIDNVPDSVWSGLTVALGAPEPFSAVVSFFGNAAVQQLDKPEPFGTTSILSQYVADDGVEYSLATEGNNMEDTLTPTWPTPTRWDNVPVTSDLRVRVTLTDEDLSDNDAIGVVELNDADINAAAAAGQVFHAKVNDQANAQILFIGVSVRQTGVQ